MADPSDPRQKRRLSPVRQLAMALPAGSSLRPRRARRTPRLLSASLLSRPGQGSALVQALMILSVAVIAALALSTRLLAARGGSFSRSDTLAAREAAEYGLNEIQSQLNTSQFGYLWVTKWDSANNRWRSVTSTDLTNCSLSARDSSGNVIANPGLPAGVTSTKTIRNDSGVTVQYRVTNFEPPNLPDNNTATKDQAAYCNPVTAAANFGNLNGGSARITVEGIVTRGSGANAVTSRFRLRRQSHVQPPLGITPVEFPFIILGNAYQTASTPRTLFGNAADIAKLNYFADNICIGTITDTTCTQTTNPRSARIGCFDLNACLINNIDTVPLKTRSKYCAQSNLRTRLGLTCNNLQQLDPESLPTLPTPANQGVLVGANTYQESDWSNLARRYQCSIGNSGTSSCTYASTTGNNFGSATNNIYFPYSNSIPTSISKLQNKDLARGCYFSGSDASDQNSPNVSGRNTNNATAINCLVHSLTISGASGSSPDLVIRTGPTLPVVNLFLHGTDTITLSNGGIVNSDLTASSWSRLRLIGKSQAPAASGAIGCAASSSIVSTRQGNTQYDLERLWLWLPNSGLIYNDAQSDNSTYMLAWVCMFQGPASGIGNGNKYSIITPNSTEVVSALGGRQSGSNVFTRGLSYRGFGSEDIPL